MDRTNISSISRQSAATRGIARTIWLGGAWLNLPEFTWLVRCVIVTDHYSFQYPRGMSFGYLYAVGSGELIIRLVEQKDQYCNMAIEHFQCVRH